MPSGSEDDPSQKGENLNKGEETTLVKRVQKNLKISVTKRSNKLTSLIKEEASKDAILSQLEKISIKVQEAEKFESEHLDTSQNPEDEQWIKQLHDTLNTREKDAHFYIQSIDKTSKEKITSNKDNSTLENTESTTTNQQNNIENMDLTQQENSTTLKEYMINERIDYIQKLINEKATSFTKIKRLNDKLIETINDFRSTSSDPFYLEWFYKMEHQVDICSAEALEYISENSDNKKEHNIIKKNPLNDQLERIKLPRFEGKKDNYFTWKSAFDACVDASNVNPEIKLLHLRQSLQGEALKSIEGLGHSASAYKKSLEVLEKKFGGTRRRTAMYLEKVNKFTPMKGENTSELERLADLLNLLIISFEDSNKTEELGNGFLFLQIQKKLTNSLLTQFHRWVHETKNSETIYTLSEFINLESEFRIKASETINGSSSDKTRTYQIQLKCCLCEKKHNIENCDNFKNMTQKEKWKIVRKYKLCYRCLKGQHIRRTCKSNLFCTIENCKKSHHKLLHPCKKIEESRSVNQNIHKEHRISLRTLPVLLHHNNTNIVVNALLDDGSEQTFIKEDVARTLGLKEINKRKLSVDVFGGNDVSIFTSDVEFEISNVKDEKRYKVSCMTSKDVVGDCTAIDWNTHRKTYQHLSTIPFNQPIKQGQIGILIGIDHPHLHTTIQEIKSDTYTDPIARLTPLGWTCIGQIRTEKKVRIRSTYIKKLSMFAKNQQDIADINKTLNKFWEIEALPHRENIMSENDRLINEHMLSNLKRSDDGLRYQVSIPWNPNKPNLNNNYGQAWQRLKNTESQLKKRPNIEEAYKSNLELYEKKNYIRKIDPSEVKDTKWYLPHFPVVKPDRETTKVRIVFDASAQYKGISLNNAIDQGPDLQQDLFQVLLRFRKNTVALTCDISEMFMQIEIKPEDRKYFRFIWRRNPLEYPTIYEWQRVIFGGNASPYLAHLVSKENAKKFEKTYPRAVETIQKSTYTDDSLDSVNTPAEALQLYKELKVIWNNAGMDARKWLSNDIQVMKNIPIDERTKQIDISKNSGLPTTKTLGVIWNAQEDTFSFKIAEFEEKIHTKRIFLKMMSSIFDPLGFLSAFIVKAKIIMQTIWIKQFDWDEDLDESTLQDINLWVSELPEINKIRIPRCLTSKKEFKQTQLHVFVDASENAMAAVAYLRKSIDNNNIEVFFISSKTKIAPIQTMSIPRLELMAAELGVSMKEQIITSISLSKEDIIFWTDSKDVMGWIKNRSKLFKPFVAHRVGKIQQTTEGNKWMHIPSKLNPADLASRGIKASELASIPEWYNGPTFLSDSQDSWPEQQRSESELKETRSKFILILNISKAHDWKLEPEKFSSWKRLCRTTAWVIRFIKNCKTTNRLNGTLTPSEIQDAQNLFIRKAQHDKFTEEINQLQKNENIPDKSKISVLCPQLDEDGLLRANTRLENAKFLSFDTKYPIILPKGHRVTELIIKEYHENGNHTRGTNATLSDISSKYWIISAREEIRKWESSCNKCKKTHAKPKTQIMAPLPIQRVSSSMKAFESCGLDYAGPFHTKAGRGKPKHKRYLCLFTCTATRAAHLEMAYSLDTCSFLNSFWRFTHRRGTPKEIVSDNGTNFISGEKELKKLVNSLNKEEIINKTAHKNINWKFNPPHSPHHGGVFESMIKSAKKAMYSQINNSDITDEELMTTITGAEAMLNSRPLTYQSANSKDITPLTPNHFLHGQQGGEFAPEHETEKFTINKRWKYTQKIIGNIWRRWVREWIPSIGKRNKWTQKHKNIDIGQIVVVLWPDLPRMKWPLGKIVEAIEGKDGNVRVVKVLVQGKIYKRGLNTILPLDINE